MIEKECYCGIKFETTEAEIKRGGGKYCSENCYHKSRCGKRSTNWKGGRKINRDGYIELYKPDHPNSDIMGYVKEHVFIMSEFLRRKLEKGEVVHHIDEIRDNNDIDNLELMLRGEHVRLHNKNRVMSDSHRLAISKSKKSISHLIKRNSKGQFLKGAKYGKPE